MEMDAGWVRALPGLRIETRGTRHPAVYLFGARSRSEFLESIPSGLKPG